MRIKRIFSHTLFTLQLLLSFTASSSKTNENLHLLYCNILIYKSKSTKIKQYFTASAQKMALFNLTLRIQNTVTFTLKKIFMKIYKLYFYKYCSQIFSNFDRVGSNLITIIQYEWCGNILNSKRVSHETWQLVNSFKCLYQRE